MTSQGRAAMLALGFLGCGRISFDTQDSGEDTLTVSPIATTINVGSKVTLQVGGGIPPYVFALDGEGSLIDDNFFAPSHAGETTVRVADAEGATGMALIRYQGDRLFVVGGLEGNAAVPSVLTSLDGAVWTTIGSLPTARANGALVVYDDRLFYLGGLNAGGSATREIWASADGASWSLHGMLPLTNTGFTSVVHGGEMWIVGGSTSSGNAVEAYHSKDAVTWSAAAPITTGRHEHDLVTHDGRLYVLGGHGDAAFLDDVQSTIDGDTWQLENTRLTFACDFAAAGQLGDRVFRTCGSGCLNTESSLDMTTWTPGAELPVERDGGALIGFGGRLLVIGGDADVLETIDGTSWTVVGALPVDRSRTAVAQFSVP